jgi:hypothetical protein
VGRVPPPLIHSSFCVFKILYYCIARELLVFLLVGLAEHLAELGGIINDDDALSFQCSAKFLKFIEERLCCKVPG